MNPALSQREQGAWTACVVASRTGPPSLSAALCKSFLTQLLGFPNAPPLQAQRSHRTRLPRAPIPHPGEGRSALMSIVDLKGITFSNSLHSGNVKTHTSTELQPEPHIPGSTSIASSSVSSLLSPTALHFIFIINPRYHFICKYLIIHYQKIKTLFPHLK